MNDQERPTDDATTEDARARAIPDDEAVQHPSPADGVEQSFDAIDSLLSDLDEQDVPSQAEALCWAVVDEYASEQQQMRLQELVVAHDEARRRFIACMQLHVGLIYHFHRTKDAARPKLWPVFLERVLIIFCPDYGDRLEIWNKQQEMLARAMEVEFSRQAEEASRADTVATDDMDTADGENEFSGYQVSGSVAIETGDEEPDASRPRDDNPRPVRYSMVPIHEKKTFWERLIRLIRGKPPE